MEPFWVEGRAPFLDARWVTKDHETLKSQLVPPKPQPAEFVARALGALRAPGAPGALGALGALGAPGALGALGALWALTPARGW